MERLTDDEELKAIEKRIERNKAGLFPLAGGHQGKVVYVGRDRQKNRELGMRYGVTLIHIFKNPVSPRLLRRGEYARFI